MDGSLREEAEELAAGQCPAEDRLALGSGAVQLEASL